MSTRWALALVMLSLPACAAARPIRTDNNNFADRLHAARPGDTLALAPGVYPGGWWIDVSGAPGRPLVITALEGPGTVIVQGGDEGINIADGAHDIVLSNIEVRGTNDNLVHVQGGAHDIVLRNLHVHHAGPNGDGIKVNQAHDITIERIDCHDPGPRPDRPDGNPSQECIDMVDVQRVVVRDSYLHDGGNQLIFVKGASRDVVIERNVIARQGPDAIDPCVGLGGSTDLELLRGHAYEASDVVFRNNVVADCRAGGIGVYDAERVWIVNDTLVDVGDDGIQFRAGNGPAGESRNVHAINNWFVQRAGSHFTPFVLLSHEVRDFDAHSNALSIAPGVTLETGLVDFASGVGSIVTREVPRGVPSRWDPAVVRSWGQALPPFLVDRGVTLRGAGGIDDDALGAQRPTGTGVDIGAFEVGAPAAARGLRGVRWPSDAHEVDPVPSPVRPPPAGPGPHAEGCVGGGCTVRGANDRANFGAWALMASASLLRRRVSAGLVRHRAGVRRTGT